MIQPNHRFKSESKIILLPKHHTMNKYGRDISKALWIPNLIITWRWAVNLLLLLPVHYKRAFVGMILDVMEKRKIPIPVAKI